MSNGTTLNNVYAARMHKRNAHQDREDAREMLEYYTHQLLILAAMTPQPIDEGDGPVSWPFYVRREVVGIVEEMQHQWWKEWAAGYIEDSPSDCKDELVESDWQEEGANND